MCVYVFSEWPGHHCGINTLVSAEKGDGRREEVPGHTGQRV